MHAIRVIALSWNLSRCSNGLLSGYCAAETQALSIIWLLFAAGERTYVASPHRIIHDSQCYLNGACFSSRPFATYVLFQLTAVFEPSCSTSEWNVSRAPSSKSHYAWGDFISKMIFYKLSPFLLFVIGSGFVSYWWWRDVIATILPHSAVLT